MKKADQRVLKKATAFPTSDALDDLPASPSKNWRAGHLLKRRQSLAIGCWNVCSMKCLTSQTFIAGEIHRPGLDILCVSETRINDTLENHEIATPDSENSFFFYNSGPKDGSGSAGVGFLLNIQAQKALIEWEPVSSRLAKARFRSKLFNVTVFAVYAPTRVSSEQAIDTFYAELNEAVKKTPKRDLLIIGGDLNAHVGSRQANGVRSLGIHGYGERCERGTRLVQFAQANNLVIANTLFRHKPSHVITWRSRDGRTSSQLDYLLVSSRWRSSIQNCRAYRGPDTGSKGGSDHTLVKMSVKIRLVARKRKEPPKRFDVARLKDPTVVEQFRVQLSNRFTALEHEHSNESPEAGNSSGSSVNEDWQKFRNTLQEVALETLGRVKRKRRRWMSEETIRLATKKSLLPSRHSAEFKQLRKLCHQSGRKDRRKHWENMTVEIQKAASLSDTRKLYQLLKVNWEEVEELGLCKRQTR
ncbi:craniofacial development protein 2-like [Artemia franciscana]|uniref:craniofacial development protein 2-like n=1 Tax=Artemia franciscana TaxID=6661 RepID=UPI0032DBD64E